MKKKIAVFTTQLPSMDSGTRVRNYYLLEGLRKEFDVTLYCFLENKVNEKSFKENIYAKTKFFYLSSFETTQKIIDFLSGGIPYVQRLRRSLETISSIELDPKTDICIFQELNSFFVLERFIDQLPGLKILDAHNIETVKIKGELQAKGLLSKLLGKKVVQIMKQEENKALAKFDLVITTSEHDTHYFQEIIPKTKVETIPNGVDLHIKPIEDQNKKPSLLFLGLLSYPPNDDALSFFIDEIYPLVKRDIPNVSFTILGKGAQPWLKEYTKKDNSVKLRGFVTDISPIIGKATICICPLRYGSGTRLKILEYMAFGKPVISTSIGAEGINVEDGKNIILQDSAHGFAHSILELLQDKNRASNIAAEGKKLVKYTYDWHIIQSKFVRLLNSL